MVAPAKLYTVEDFAQFTAQYADRLFQPKPPKITQIITFSMAQKWFG